MELPLSVLGTELRAAYGQAPPSYVTLWQRVAKGDLPQIIRRGSRLFFNSEDLPAIALSLGIVSRKETAARGPE